MDIKYFPLIQCLVRQDDWVTSSYLSVQLDISIRTVKSYVGAIQDEQPLLIESSPKGYRIDKTMALALLASTHQIVPQTPGERQRFLAHRLIEQNNQPLDIYDIAEEIYVSDSTIKADLRKLRKKFDNFNLTLSLNGSYALLKGSEKNKRRMMSSLLFEESGDNFVNFSTIQDAFSEYDVHQLKELVLTTFRQARYFINDYSLINLTLHIVIAMDRIQSGFVSVNQGIKNEHKSIPVQERQMSEEIACHISQSFGINYSQHEIDELALLISSSGTNINFADVEMQNLRDLVGENILSLVSSLTQFVNQNYAVDLSAPDFITRFSLHMKNLMERLESGVNCRNPLVDSIKAACPLIYDCAVSVSHQIKQKTGYSISDDEIGFIAFHIGSTIETQKSFREKLCCALYVPQYYDAGNELAERIYDTFAKDIMIKHITSREEDLAGLTIDFIISTANLLPVPEQPLQVISPFFTVKDQAAIRRFIERLKQKKTQEAFKQHLNAVFSPKLFLKNPPFLNEAHTLEQTCRLMKEEGYVDKNFYSNVLEREALSTTAFGRVAIPHSMKMQSKKSGMFVILSDKGISWGNSKVHIVLLLSISSDSRRAFREIFDVLPNILSDDCNINLLLRSKNYNEFIETLIACCPME